MNLGSSGLIGVKEIVMADRAGFCFGVKRAVDAIIETLESRASTRDGEVCSIGMPIHNPQEVERLKSMGLKVAENVDEIPEGATVLVRAHGESRAVMEELRGKGGTIVDMTCPHVRRAQERASAFSSQGYQVVLLGDARHPEIRSIMGYVDGPIDVVANVAEAEVLPKRSRVALISQTTQQEELLAGIAAALVPRTGELCVCNTICKATVERQEAVRRLAGKVDGVVLVGGKESANTAKLRDIALASGIDVLWIESIDEMDWGWLEGKIKIGIAAGASTPQWLITEVCNKIARM